MTTFLKSASSWVPAADWPQPVSAAAGKCQGKTGAGQADSTAIPPQKKQGKAILLASHNAQDIEELCDDIHEMEEKWK